MPSNKVLTYDISDAPIAAEDYLIVETQEHQHRFKVVQVHDLGERRRNIDVAKISSTDPDEPKTRTIQLFPGVAVFGQVLPKESFVSEYDEQSIDPGKLNNLILTHLELWLGNFAHVGYSAPFGEAVLYLQREGMLPGGTIPNTHAERWKHPAYKRLSGLLKTQTGRFISKGGNIKLEKGGVMTTKHVDTSMASTGPKVVKVKKVFEAIEALLESGLFGEIILEYND